MTPQEQELVEELFDRLAKLENMPRDPAAERLIADGVRRAPHAAYALVQTALVMDEALKSANARIEELLSQSRAASSTACDGPCLVAATRAVPYPMCAPKPRSLRPPRPRLLSRRQDIHGRRRLSCGPGRGPGLWIGRIVSRHGG